ncbi:uncharacterized protein LOC134844179 [Symsagittifera roscoffensis]|uniref:uncharacterized protein LOC134844179 n=1 Tax=Symsagittifera roscoffensis TaxID=84072 RepID=UPI00307BCC22
MSADSNKPSEESEAYRKQYHQLVFTLLFFACLLLSLMASVVVSGHKFITTEETVTEKVSIVTEHDKVAIIFFGVGNYLELCSLIFLQPGSLEIDTLFAKGVPCQGQQINIPLNSSDIQYLKDHPLNGTADFDSYINSYILNHFANVTASHQSGERSEMNLTITVIEGPSLWQEKETVYAKIRSPKDDFLQPMYLLMQSQQTEDSFKSMQTSISSSYNLEALFSFNDFISKEMTSFRLVASETATMFTMNDATILHEHKQVTMRKIHAELTYMCSFNKRGGMIDCDQATMANTNTTEPTAPNYFLYPKCPSAEDENKTTYSESLFRWADGHLSEKISSKKRNLWEICGAVATLILGIK